MERVDLAGAVQVLKRGGLVVYPTETLYGLAADIRQPKALDRLFRVKGRDADKPVSILLSSLSQLSQVTAELSPRVKKLLEHFLPGPLTFVLPALPELDPRIHAGTHWVGIRLSSHPLAQALVEALGSPITATSANLSGAPSITRERDAARAFRDQTSVALFPGGDLPPSPGSTVVKVQEDELILLREGEIKFAEIQSVF